MTDENNYTNNQDPEEPTVEGLKTGKHEYKVVFSYTEGGAVWVKADSGDEAEQKVYAWLEWNGLDDTLQKEGHFDCTSREYDTYESEVVE